MITNLDAHALKIVETVFQTLDVSAMTKLGLGKVVLELSTICVVIGRVAIDETIKHDCIERHTPIGRRRIEGMVLPFPRVVEGIDSSDIGVEVEGHLLCIISEGRYRGAQEQ